MLFIWSLFALALATAERGVEPPYVSGRALYETERARLASEHGVFVEVPIDYSDPSRGTTPIYVALPNGFDPARPSLIYFEGGPGGSCHHPHGFVTTHDPVRNVVLFDQRGISLSRPATEEMHRDANFYSALNTARDADTIRRHLGIDVWTLVGGSYGSIPATVYASTFPHHTFAVVLTGTVYTMVDRLRDGRRLRDFHYRSRLFAELRAINAGSESNLRIMKAWIHYYLANYGSYRLPDFERTLRRFSASGGRTVPPTAAATSPPDVLDEAEPVAYDHLYAEVADYVARDYPFDAPVTYVHGTADIQTPAPNAVRHFKRVPRGPAQLILIEGLGHSLESSRSRNVPDAIFSVPPAVVAAALDGRDLRSSPAFACWRQLTAHARYVHNGRAHEDVGQ